MTEPASEKASSGIGKKIFLTFDDGPLAGTDDVIAVLNEKKAKGTLFMVGDHVNGSWRKAQMKSAHNNSYVEVANHSSSHAKNEYAKYYSKPESVVEGFEKAGGTLGIKRKLARLPGRNTWRVGEIIASDLGSGQAADMLKKKGYKIFGWDSEWKMENGRAIESPEDMLNKVKTVFERGGTRRENKQVILMHDTMFRQSIGGREKLSRFIDLLRQQGYETEFISKY